MDLLHSYRIVVPTTIYNKVAPARVVEEIRNHIKRELAAAFGGYTETTGRGGYKAESGELIEERVFVIEACYEKPDDELIKRLAGKIKTEMKQESVMIRKDNRTWFL